MRNWTESWVAGLVGQGFNPDTRPRREVVLSPATSPPARFAPAGELRCDPHLERLGFPRHGAATGAAMNVIGHDPLRQAQRLRVGRGSFVDRSFVDKEFRGQEFRGSFVDGSFVGSFVDRRSWHFHETGFPATSLLPPLSPTDLRLAPQKRGPREKIDIDRSQGEPTFEP